MIKSFLKQIFPIKVLKNAFLFYNRIKAKTVDRFFYPEKRITQNDFLFYGEKNPFLENNVPVSHFSQEIQQLLTLWLDKNWTQDEYILEFKESGLIDPDYGWAMTRNHELIYPSLGFSRAPYVKKPSIVKSYFSKRKIVHIDSIISLRDTGEENYFHLYNDILPKIFILQDHNIDPTNYIVVVSEKLYSKTFFQFIISSSPFKDLKWHVQQDEWISFNKALFAKPATHTKKYLNFFTTLNTKSGSSTKTNRRIFLTRDRRSLRFIENMDELEPMLKQYHFDIVETSTMPVASQIDLFASCEYLIGIHGAGLTNIIYRGKKPLTFLEIVPPVKYIPFHYILLAHVFSYRYEILLGDIGRLKNYGGFRVNSTVLASKLNNMLPTTDSINTY